MTINILGILRLIAMASRRRPHRNVYDQRQFPESVGEYVETRQAVDSCNAALRECEPTVRRVRAGS